MRDDFFFFLFQDLLIFNRGRIILEVNTAGGCGCCKSKYSIHIWWKVQKNMFFLCKAAHGSLLTVFLY